MPSRALSARLLASARGRAGLSQRALADAGDTTQSVVARIELGATSPTWATLSRLVAAAGFQLRPDLVPLPRLDAEASMEVGRILSLSPQSRLADASVDAQRALLTLARHRVRHVLIGTAAGRIHGLPRPAGSLELVPAADGA